MALERITPVARSLARGGEAKLKALLKEKFRSNGWPTGVVFEPVTSDAQAAARVQEIRNNAAAFKDQGIKVTAGPWIRDLDNGSFKLSIRYEMDLTRPAYAKKVYASVDEAVKALGAKISQTGEPAARAGLGAGNAPTRSTTHGF